MTNLISAQSSPNVGVIAVIVPVYNVAHYLKECLDSLLAQTYPYWIAYVIDDESTDESGKIADEYAFKDSRFKVFHKPNGGVSSARNYGLDQMEQSREKYAIVGFLDSDDWLAPETYENIIRVKHEKNPDIIFHGYTYVYVDKVIVPKFIKETGPIDCKTFLEAVFSDTAYGEWKESNGTHGNIWTKYLNPDLLKGVRFIEDKAYVEDELFNTCVALKGESFYFIAESYYFYRQRKGSLVRAGEFLARLERGRLVSLEVIRQSKLSGKNFLIFQIKLTIIRMLLIVKKNIKYFLEYGRLFSQIASYVADVIDELLSKNILSEEDCRFLRELISFGEEIDKLDSGNSGVDDLIQKKEELIKIVKYVNQYKSKLYNFNISKYLKYKILSKLTFGNMCLRHKKKYKEQKEFSRVIKSSQYEQLVKIIDGKHYKATIALANSKMKSFMKATRIN